MGKSVVVDGPRLIRAQLDTAGDATTAVLCCPPDPRSGGSRSDPRLLAITEALTAAGIDCLRISYPEPVDAEHTPTDLLAALNWLQDRYTSVGILGYSFGGAMAIQLGKDPALAGVVALCPPATVLESVAVTDAIDELGGPGLLCVGTADQVVDTQSLLVAARTADMSVIELSTGHAMTGAVDRVADAVVSFFTSD